MFYTHITENQLAFIDGTPIQENTFPSIDEVRAFMVTSLTEAAVGEILLEGAIKNIIDKVIAFIKGIIEKIKAILFKSEEDKKVQESISTIEYARKDCIKVLDMAKKKKITIPAVLNKVEFRTWGLVEDFDNLDIDASKVVDVEGVASIADDMISAIMDDIVNNKPSNVTIDSAKKAFGTCFKMQLGGPENGRTIDKNIGDLSSNIDTGNTFLRQNSRRMAIDVTEELIRNYDAKANMGKVVSVTTKTVSSMEKIIDTLKKSKDDLAKMKEPEDYTTLNKDIRTFSEVIDYTVTIIGQTAQLFNGFRSSYKVTCYNIFDDGPLRDVLGLSK